MGNNHKFEGNCYFNNENLEKNTNLILTNNKLSMEISQHDTEEKISNYIKNGVFNFGLDLFFGSVEQNLEVIQQLRSAASKESEYLGFTIPLSIYLKLSPRLQYTGRFKRNKTGVNLKLHRQVVLTTNRAYASGSCHSFIYVNAKFLVDDVRKCDIICLGKIIQLQVVEVKGDHVVCKVIVPGLVTSRMRVRFPEYVQKAHLKVSAEELEDITLAIETNINVIISHTPVDFDYCNQLRDTLAELKCSHFYLFTRLELSYLKKLEDANWITEAYDGFLIDCSNQVPDDKIVKLSPEAQVFIEESYRKRKPIFLQGCWSNFVHPSDYHYAFQYPDKFILPCKPKFLRIFEAIFHKLSQTHFLENIVHKKMTLSSTSLLARSIAAASYDFQADAIVICSTVGEMAIRIAHFRPKAVILGVTSLKSVVNYSSMHHNIRMFSFDMKDKTKLYKEETHQKLVYGLQYALLKKLVDSLSGTVVLVFRQHIKYRSTDKFAVIKIDNDYVETIRNVIFN